MSIHDFRVLIQGGLPTKARRRYSASEISLTPFAVLHVRGRRCDIRLPRFALCTRTNGCQGYFLSDVYAGLLEKRDGDRPLAALDLTDVFYAAVTGIVLTVPGGLADRAAKALVVLFRIERLMALIAEVHLSSPDPCTGSQLWRLSRFACATIKLASNFANRIISIRLVLAKDRWTWQLSSPVRFHIEGYRSSPGRRRRRCRLLHCSRKHRYRLSCHFCFGINICAPICVISTVKQSSFSIM